MQRLDQAPRELDQTPRELDRASRGGLARALAWGLLWAVLGALALYLIAPDPWRIQPSRASELRASLSVLEHGGPALLGYRSGSHAPYAIGYSDDQGVYAIVPVLSRWLGQSDPIATLRWMWVAAWAITLLASAAVARALFGSSWAALLAPPALLVCILFFGFGDIYWVSAWVVVTFAAPLILLTRHRPRWAGAALVAIALVAGVATAIRSEAGLPVALAAAAVAMMVGRRWSSRAPVVAAIVVAYFAPTSIVLPAIRAHRDQRIGVDLSAREPASHPLWHSLYTGLGYTPNRYRIHYLDAYGAAAAQELDPGVRFLSPAYSRALHHQVDALIEHDPGFVAKAEAQKTVVELSHTGRYLLLLALLLPAALAARGRAGLRASELALLAPTIAIGALPAIVAVPFRDYELTLLAALGTLGLLAVGSAAARAQQTWRDAPPPGGGSPGRTRMMLRGVATDWPARPTIGALIVTAAILIPVFLFARHVEAEHERWDRNTHNPPTVVLARAPAGVAPPRA
jgi:hypothetical protein